MDVRGFQISVDDALFVCGFERVGDLLKERNRFVDGERASRDALCQRLPGHELHHQKVLAAVVLEAIGRRRPSRLLRAFRKCDSGRRFYRSSREPLTS